MRPALWKGERTRPLGNMRGLGNAGHAWAQETPAMPGEQSALRGVVPYPFVVSIPWALVL